MISNWIFIIGMVLIGMLCYFIGLRRGIIGSQHLYDDGWTSAEGYFKRFPELVQDIDKMTDKLYEEHEREKQQKARRLVKELDDLFDPECPIPEEIFPDPPKNDVEIIDGGFY